MEQSFIVKGLGDYSEAKITAMGLFENYIILGDEKANLQTLIFSANKKLTVENSLNLGQYGKKIDKIIISHPKALAFVMINGDVHAYHLPKLEHICEIRKESIVGIALDAADKVEKARLLTITKKRKVKIYQFDKIKNELDPIKSKDLYLDEAPEIYEWYDKYLCYKHKNKVHWVHLDTGKNIPMDMDDTIEIKYVHENLLVTNSDIGMFLEVGTVKPINPINLKQKFIEIGEFKNYLIALHEEQIIIFVKIDQRYDLIQTIDCPNGEVGRFLLESKNNIVYVTTNNQGKFNFYHLEETPYDLIIKKLLNESKFEDALTKLNDNVPPSDESKPKCIENFFLNCSWMSLTKKDFAKAYEYGHITNFNPFEFIYLFYSLLNVKIMHSDFEKKIKEQLSKNQIKGLVGDDEAKLKAAYTFLLKILIDKRNHLTSRYELPKQNAELITFDSSEYSLINLSTSTTQIPVGDIVNVINLTLVKLMIKLKQHPKDISSIVDSPYFNSDGISDFQKDSFFEENNTDECQLAMAYFYEKKGEYEKALQIWKKFGTEDKGKKVQLFSSEAKERTKKIFYKLKSETEGYDKYLNLFQTFIKWLLVKYPDDAFEVEITTQFIPIDEFLSNVITNVEDTNKDTNLKERFLTFYNERAPTENYQTALIEVYIDKLLKMKSPDTNIADIPFEGELKTYHDLLMKAIQQEKSVYNKNFILNKVKGTWLIDAEIYLYSELKMHNLALDKLLDGVAQGKDDFTKVEEYCEKNLENKPEIFSDYFQKLLERKKTVDPKEKENKYEKEMMNVLQNYGDVSKLDPLFALENIPLESNVCDGVLYDYITKAIKEYTSLTNKYKIARNISDMALIYKEKEVLDGKDKCVVIENETVCELCRKKIGNTIFVVYPNKKIYHSKCATNMSICPTTGVDFTKKKTIE